MLLGNRQGTVKERAVTCSSLVDAMCVVRYARLGKYVYIEIRVYVVDVL